MRQHKTGRVLMLLGLSICLSLSACQLAGSTGAVSTGAGAEIRTESADGGSSAAEQQETVAPEPQTSAEGKLAENRNYSYLNGIRYFEKRMEDYDHYISSIQIEGLQDSQIQEKINERLKQEVLALYEKDLPPYRGIRVMTNTWEPDKIYQYIYSHVYFNASNLLSVGIEKTISCSGSGYYIRDELPLTFDLNTGEIISFADLFADGYDYQQEICEYIRDCAAGGSFAEVYPEGYDYVEEQFTLLTPFEQVRQNQKFLITDAGEISLLLDYETPEFDVNMSTVYLPIPIEKLSDKGSGLVFEEKYDDGSEKLYQTGFRRYKTLKRSLNTVERSWRYGDSTSEDANRSIQLTLLPDLENKELRAMMERSDAEFEASALIFISEDGNDFKASTGSDYYFTAERYDDFVMIIESYNVWGQEMRSEWGGKTRVYHADTGEIVHLKECFADGVDYEQILTPLLYQENPELTEYDLTEFFKEPEFGLEENKLLIYVNTGPNPSSYEIDFKAVGNDNLSFFQN